MLTVEGAERTVGRSKRTIRGPHPLQNAILVREGHLLQKVLQELREGVLRHILFRGDTFVQFFTPSRRIDRFQRD
eukprot:5339475-Pyramimonas_sp.AAC.1